MCLRCYLIYVAVQPGAFMVDIFYRHALLSHIAAKVCDTPRTVAHGGNKANETLVSGESSVNNSTENCSVDVTPAKRNNNLLALEPTAKRPSR